MGLGSSKRANEPADFERTHPHFTHFIEVAPGCWNYRTNFVVGKLVDVKTHMNVVRLASGDFVAIDAADLTVEAQYELNELTGNGERLIACIFIHPFHTLAIPAFHALYPSSDRRKYYGCPRHLRLITTDEAGTTIQWAGDLNRCSVRAVFEPDLEMRIPEGAEFIDPQPAYSNHLSGVFVFHKPSKTLILDDTVVYIREPGFLLNLFGFKPYSMHFHPALKGPGLYKTKEAPLAFLQWFQQVLNDWDFDNLVSAHNGGCYGVAKETAQALLTAHVPILKRLSDRNARRADNANDSVQDSDDDDDAPQGWSQDLLKTECG